LAARNETQRAWPARINQSGAASAVVVGSIKQTEMARRDTSPPESISDSQPQELPSTTTTTDTVRTNSVTRIKIHQTQGERLTRDGGAETARLDGQRDRFFAQLSVFSQRCIVDGSDYGH
jgi:hypothetical protein